MSVCATGVTFHLLARPAGYLNTLVVAKCNASSSSCEGASTTAHEPPLRWHPARLPDNADTGRELWNIHCRSLVGVIKAEDISQACCNALSL